jgi:hypothetical protein
MINEMNHGERELVELYYDNLGEGYFFDALKNYSKGEGFGLGDIWCVFAEEIKTEEEGYFGETGVAYFFDYPAVEKNEVLVFNYDVFYSYLQEVSFKFIKVKPECEMEIKEYLLKIKTRYDLGK